MSFRGPRAPHMSFRGASPPHRALPWTRRGPWRSPDPSPIQGAPTNVNSWIRACKKICSCLEVGFVGFILKQRKFITVRYEWRHNSMEKNIVYYVISFREGWYGFRKPQCGDPEHRITLCEFNSIKTDKIGGYIISVFIKAWYKGFFLNSLLSIWLPIIFSNTCKTILASWKNPQISTFRVMKFIETNLHM